MTRLIRALALLLVGFPVLASSPPIVGTARTIDGDTIEIAGTRIRLYGIDAPEIDQTCRHDSGVEMLCGEDAALILGLLVQGRDVICYPVDADRYGRVVARCTEGGYDVAATMVLNGQAIDVPHYSGGEYAGLEAAAKVERRGIWATTFVEPSEWRRGR